MLPRGFAPRPSAFARRHARLLHLGSLENVCIMPVLPRALPRVLRTAVERFGRPPGRVVPMRAATSMMLDYCRPQGLAEFGIAPNSPRLQRGANLSQLFSLKWVPPRGNAPRSISNRLMALLLSYGGYCHKKSPVKVTLPRIPGVGRARCYYANGRKVVTASGLSPDRTGLRTRVLEILCICGV